MPIDLNDPYIQKEAGNVKSTLQALRLAGLAPTGAPDFPIHWADGDGWFTGVVDGRVWVAYPDDEERKNKMWFDSIEQADAWVLACWRMR